MWTLSQQTYRRIKQPSLAKMAVEFPPMTRIPPKNLFLVLLCLLPTTFIVELSMGPVALSPFFGPDANNAASQLILWDIRFPRALLAASTGAILAMSGVMMQGLFRNGLADPSLIGATAGASAGASFTIVLGVSWLGLNSALLAPLLVSGAFLGAVITTMAVYRLATSATGTSVTTMLLAGIAITALAGALNSLFSYLADNDILRQISLWQMGDLNGASWLTAVSSTLLAIALLVAFNHYHQSLNALLLGESEARHLGIRVQTLKRNLIILVSLAIGVSVSLTGIIGFVGLIIPHFIRLLSGPDHRHLIPFSALAGACLLMLADTVSRVIIAPAELPIGVVTAALGAPFFLILLRQKKSGENNALG